MAPGTGMAPGTVVLYSVIRRLQHLRVVLASASPRRQEILSNAGLKCELVPSRFKEKLSKASFPTPQAYAMQNAKEKALEVARRMYQKDLRVPDVVIGADTIVVVGGLILEKPADKQDAYNMLSRLSGKEHSVFTGVSIVHCSCEDGRLETDVTEFYEETRVQFSQLSEELLWDYVHSGEPLDKAGGYGIQALGGMLVESIHGDFYNVVGFPLNHFCKKLGELYCPPCPGEQLRVKHDSIPTVDTFENLGDVKATAHGEQGHGQGRAQVGSDQPWAQGAQDAGQNQTVESMPPTEILQLLDGFKVSKAVLTACKLEVFDALKDDAPLSAGDVARKIGASEDGTGRLLDVCVALGLLHKTERGYSNSGLAGRYLLADSEFSLHGLALHYDDSVWCLFTHLHSAIRGASGQHLRGLGSPADNKSQDPHDGSLEKKLQSMGARHALIKTFAHRAVTTFDLSAFTSVCDLGGCTGALAHELAREYPGTEVVVLDLPDVLKGVGPFQPRGPHSQQVSFVPGDFFKDALPETDLYVLCGVLRRRPDDEVRHLLGRIAGCCKPGGGILLLEVMLDEEKRAPLPALLQSLGELARAGGRERTAGQYRQLLQAHGFADVRAVPGAASVPGVMLATRTAP